MITTIIDNILIAVAIVFGFMALDYMIRFMKWINAKLIKLLIVLVISVGVINLLLYLIK